MRTELISWSISPLILKRGDGAKTCCFMGLMNSVKRTAGLISDPVGQFVCDKFGLSRDDVVTERAHRVGIFRLGRTSSKPIIVALETTSLRKIL